MSTILDALRRLEREREEQESSKELRRAVARERPEGPARPRSRASLWVAIALGLLVGASAYGFLLMPEFKSAAESLVAADPPEATAQAVQRRPTRRPATPRVPTQTLSRVAPERPTAEPASRRAMAESKPVLRAAPSPEAASPGPQEQSAAPRPMREARRPEALGTTSARAPKTPTPPTRTRALETAPAPSPPLTPELKAVTEPARAPIPRRSSPPPSTEPVTRVAEASPRGTERSKVEVFESQPTPRSEPEGTDVLSPVGFPPVIVESVRWHPSADRRVARVQIDRAGPLDVREGDIVAGVLVELIRPAAVQLRLGGNTRIVALEP